MKISMWIVKDWLSKYNPVSQIVNGERTINGVRYLADEIELNKDYLYIGYNKQFISSDTHSVICVNGKDIIRLNAPDIYTIFNEIQQMLEFYNTWETNILQAINTDADIDSILDYAGMILNTKVVISDLSLKVMGESRNYSAPDAVKLVDGYLPLEEMHIINDQLRVNTANHHAYTVNTSLSTDINKNLYSKDKKLVGWFVALNSANEKINSNLQIIEAFCELIDLWFKIYISEKYTNNLFLDVLEMKETDEFNIKMRCEGIGWAGNPEMCVIVLKSCLSKSIGLSFISRYLEANHEGLSCFIYKETHVIVVNTNLININSFYNDLKVILESNNAYCGISYTFPDIKRISNALSQANIAADFGKKISGQINKCSDYALEYIQDRLISSIDTDVCSPALDVLRQYDRENNTEYYKTLFTYLIMQCDQTQAAKELNIHRNSLLYRIKKINELIDYDLSDSHDRMYLFLSFMISDRSLFVTS